MKIKISLTKPYWGKEEEKTVIEALHYSNGVGDGSWSRKTAEQLKKITGSSFVYPVTSCTHGLELSMSAFGIKQGDEVIMPSFTMSSTANCVVSKGATPVFADIDKKTYNIDPDEINKLITRKTRGIIVVHYAGMSCVLDKIINLAKRNSLFVVEDAAHAIGAKYKNKMLGTWGDIGVYSFHGTKNISCGEGGVLITDNSILAEKIAVFRANGTNRDQFIRGLIDKYSWIDTGSSYFLSDILAAIVSAQLRKLNKIIRMRGKIADYYSEQLRNYQDIIQLPVTPKYSTANWHIYSIKFYKSMHSDSFIRKMRTKNIEVSSHYIPLHSSIAGKKYGRTRGLLKITDDVSKTLVRLPIYPQITKQKLRYITDTAKNILRNL